MKKEKAIFYQDLRKQILQLENLNVWLSSKKVPTYDGNKEVSLEIQSSIPLSFLNEGYKNNYPPKAKKPHTFFFPILVTIEGYKFLFNGFTADRQDEKKYISFSREEIEVIETPDGYSQSSEKEEKYYVSIPSDLKDRDIVSRLETENNYIPRKRMDVRVPSRLVSVAFIHLRKLLNEKKMMGVSAKVAQIESYRSLKKGIDVLFFEGVSDSAYGMISQVLIPEVEEIELIFPNRMNSFNLVEQKHVVEFYNRKFGRVVGVLMPVQCELVTFKEDDEVKTMSFVDFFKECTE